MSEPVSWDLVRSEGLLSELLVSSVLDGVHLESVGVTVDVMVLGEEVGDWVEGGDDGEGHADDDLGVWYLGVSNVHEILRNVMSHLWGG